MRRGGAAKLLSLLTPRGYGPPRAVNGFKLELVPLVAAYSTAWQCGSVSFFTHQQQQSSKSLPVACLCHRRQLPVQRPCEQGDPPFSLPAATRNCQAALDSPRTGLLLHAGNAKQVSLDRACSPSPQCLPSVCVI